MANYLGQGWAALMGLTFVPQYVSRLGSEAFGLIGVFAILQSAVALLDLGLTPTLVRELAHLRAGARAPAAIRDLLRSLELLYLVLTATMVAVVWVSSPWMADGWLKVQGLPVPLVVKALRVMGFVLAARWMEQVYRGALQGLLDMVWLNVTQAVLATLRWGGALVVLVYLQATVTAFFAWQGLVSALTVALLVWRTYRLLPKSPAPARFNATILREIRKFAGGMFLGSLLAFLLMQADKIVISKMLPLEQLGFYTLATTAATGLLQLITPMNMAVLPRLIEYVARADSTALSMAYLRSCQWMSAVIVAPSLMLIFFAEPTLLMWTGDSRLAGSVAMPLSLLSLGMLFNGLMNLPYMLQLAHGWVSLSVKTNLVAVLVVLPVLAWAVPRYGVIGAASVWVGLSAVSGLVTTHFMHKRLLSAHKLQWLGHCVIAPLACGGFATWLLRSAIAAPTSRITAGLVLVGAGATTLLAVWGSLPVVRHEIWQSLRGVARQPG